MAYTSYKQREATASRRYGYDREALNEQARLEMQYALAPGREARSLQDKQFQANLAFLQSKSSNELALERDRLTQTAALERERLAQNDALQARQIKATADNLAVNLTAERERLEKTIAAAEKNLNTTIGANKEALDKQIAADKEKLALTLQAQDKWNQMNYDQKQDIAKSAETSGYIQMASSALLTGAMIYTMAGGKTAGMSPALSSLIQTQFQGTPIAQAWGTGTSYAPQTYNSGAGYGTQFGSGATDASMIGSGMEAPISAVNPLTAGIQEGGVAAYEAGGMGLSNAAMDAGMMNIGGEAVAGGMGYAGATGSGIDAGMTGMAGSEAGAGAGMGAVALPAAIIAGASTLNTAYGGVGVEPKDKSFSESFYADPISGPISSVAGKVFGTDSAMASFPQGVLKSKEEAFAKPIAKIMEGDIGGGVIDLLTGPVRATRAAIIDPIRHVLGSQEPTANLKAYYDWRAANPDQKTSNVQDAYSYMYSDWLREGDNAKGLDANAWSQAYHANQGNWLAEMQGDPEKKAWYDDRWSKVYQEPNWWEKGGA